MNDSQAGAMPAPLADSASITGNLEAAASENQAVGAENSAAPDSTSGSACGLFVSSAAIASKRKDGELDREQRAAINRENARAAQQAELAAVRRGEVLAWEQHQAEIARERGRPSSYTDEQADSLCQWIARGKSLISWCRATGVSMSAVQRWLRTRADFRSRYAQAHEDRADTLADELLEIADDAAHLDTLEAIQAAKLRVETRKWVAAKLKPAAWGDKQLVEHKGGVSIRIGVPSPAPIHAANVIDNPANEGQPLISA